MKILWPLAALVLLACDPPANQTPDAGPDTSCGLDCAAQNAFGLVVNRCFEYSSTRNAADPADLGAWVRPVVELESGVQVIPVEYNILGQPVMTDSFTLKNGELYLVRRNFQPPQSVAYQDNDGALSGVLWLKADAAAGGSQSTTAQARVIGSGNDRTEPTNYRVVYNQASADELTTPLQKYETGLQLVFNEAPAHGNDPRRIFVKDTGFVLFTTYLSLTATQTEEYRLQKVRDVAPGTTPNCGLGGP